MLSGLKIRRYVKTSPLHFSSVGIVLAAKTGMIFHLKNSSLFTLLLTFILLLHPCYLSVTERFAIAFSDKGLMNKVISVTTEEDKYGTTIKVLCNGTVPSHETKTYLFPPVILVDIFCAVPSFETMTIPVKSPNLKSIRVGHHPKKATRGICQTD